MVIKIDDEVFNLLKSLCEERNITMNELIRELAEERDSNLHVSYKNRKNTRKKCGYSGCVQTDLDHKN